MVLISHNALQPLAPTAPAAASININKPVSDEYAGGGESDGVQVKKSCPPIRGGRRRSTPRGGRHGRKWQLRTSNTAPRKCDGNCFTFSWSRLRASSRVRAARREQAQRLFTAAVNGGPGNQLKLVAASHPYVFFYPKCFTAFQGLFAVMHSPLLFITGSSLWLNSLPPTLSVWMENLNRT